MGKCSGIDNARGRANDTLTLDMAVKIGQYLGWYYGENHHAKILIGKNTRLSSDMLEVGLAAGATSCGTSVHLLGVYPTPAVSCLTQKEHFDCGIMIPASHSPFHDNGIKLFNGDGYKMNPEVEPEVKKYIDNEVSVEVTHNERIGGVIKWEEDLEPYESWLKEIVPMDLSGMNILLGLTNRSVTSCATETLNELGATVKAIYSALNGININIKYGSTYPEELQSMMKEGNYRVGFAFDGDTDRLIAVNEDRNLIDSDHTMYICGCYTCGKGVPYDDVVVATVMSNLDLHYALRVEGLKYEQMVVGDKYVPECMKGYNYPISGEQSGYVIFHAHANTGDDFSTVMKLPKIMVDTKKSLKELCADLSIYPQPLTNTSVHGKYAILEDKELLAAVDAAAQGLGDRGEALAHPSGTKPLVRVMVGAKTGILCAEYVNRVVDFIKEKGL